MTEGIPVQVYVCLSMHFSIQQYELYVFLSTTVCVYAYVLVLNLNGVSQTTSQLCQ